ncbi:hypothetical protein [Chrysiogenes arsenatis]|uniref:hypothetical protein n=1 Tax=Chrysiogenes arsenatis TaxID=309797 RepID=UPI0003F63C68|nr:hypothetical protein [Chrysiogenes arsenatis]
MKKNNLKVIRKHSRKEPMEDNRTLTRIASEASRHAIQQSLSADVPVLFERDGYLVKKTPANGIVKVRKLQAKKPFNLREYLCQD